MFHCINSHSSVHGSTTFAFLLPYLLALLELYALLSRNYTQLELIDDKGIRIHLLTIFLVVFRSFFHYSSLFHMVSGKSIATEGFSSLSTYNTWPYLVNEIGQVGLEFIWSF